MVVQLLFAFIQGFGHAFGYIVAQCLALLLQLASVTASLCVVIMLLFCVAILSGDFAYTLVRFSVPEVQVWKEECKRHWLLAWAVTWLLQVPMWLYILPGSSLFLLQEQANLALSVYHVILRRLGTRTWPIPSASLIASSQLATQGQTGKIVMTRLTPTCLYIVMYGFPPEKKLLLTCVFCDVVLLILNEVMRAVDALPWELDYRVYHGTCNDWKTASEAVDECEEHGMCSICLESLCHPAGSSLAMTALQCRRSFGNSLSAARLRRRSCAAVAGLAASRSPIDWIDTSRIATTRCGHRFHQGCLDKSAETLFRCPQCRTSFLSSVSGPELPDEEVLEAQMLCVAFGFFIGAMLSVTYWVWTARSLAILWVSAWTSPSQAQ